MHKRSVLSPFCIVMIVLGALSAHAQSIVSDWLDNASSVIVANAKKGPGTSAVYFAYVAVAMYDAASSIDGRHKTFAAAVRPPAGASPDAAVIAAAHDVLVHYFPAQQSVLDGQQTASLASLADGQAKTDGISVGKSVAVQWIALRSADGVEAKLTYAPGHGQGLWEPVPNVPAPAPNITPPPVEPWFAQFKPFALTSPDQFLSMIEKPYSLGSAEWAMDYNLTKDYGALKSAYRSPEQTEIGLFWTDHGPAQNTRAIRGLIATQHLNVSDAARLAAMAYVTLADGFAASMSAKYHFAFWRPYTAIRNADSSLNPATAADSSWTPLAPTPGHPEYPANHGTVTQAFTDAIAAFFGTDIVAITFTSNVTHTTHTFSNLQDVMREVNDARIYGGMHFRHSLLEGNILGKSVAKYVCDNFFLPTK
jgi:hypothetical protein